MLKNSDYIYVLILEYFVNLTKLAKSCELLKQKINSENIFEPKSCFTRFDRISKNYIDKDDIMRFLKENNFVFPETEYKNLNLFFEFYDKNLDGRISYREFLNFILNKRDAVLSRQIERKKLNTNQFMIGYLESQITRLLLKEISMFEWANKKKIAIFLENIDLLEIFLLLDSNQDGYLCAKDFQKFLQKFENYTPIEDIQTLISIYTSDAKDKLNWKAFLILIMPSKYTYDYDYFLLKDLESRYEKIYSKKPNIENFCALSDYRIRNESEIMPEKLSHFKNNNFEKDDSMEINIRKNKLNFDYSDWKNRNDDIIFENNKDNYKQNFDTFSRHFYLELFKIVQMDKELNILKKNLLQNYSDDIWKIFKIFDIHNLDYIDLENLKHGFEYFDLYLKDSQILLIFNKLKKKSRKSGKLK